MERIWLLAFAQIDIKHATLKIKGGGASQEVTVQLGEGNFTWTERKNVEYTLDGGNLDEVKEGDQVPVEVRFDGTWEYLKGPSSASTTSGGTPTVEDAMKNRGAAANWTSSDADACRPYAVDLELTNAPTPAACGDSEVILFQDFRYEQVDHDLRAGTLSFQGRCNIVEPTVTRSSQA